MRPTGESTICRLPGSQVTRRSPMLLLATRKPSEQLAPLVAFLSLVDESGEGMALICLGHGM